jgi:hypothetical protein
MAKRRTLLPAVALVTAALTVGTVASAQQQRQQQQRAPQTQTQSSTVTDKEITAFAAAATEVRQLNQKWLPQVQAAAKQGPEAEQRTRQQAMAEMSRAVENRGLSVERYSMILDQTQTDPELNRKIQERMQSQR